MFIESSASNFGSSFSRRPVLPGRTDKSPGWDGPQGLPLFMSAQAGAAAPAANRPVTGRPSGPAPRAPLAPPPPPSFVQAAVRSTLLLALLMASCIAAYLLFSQFVMTMVVIQGRSMMPTLHDGDHYLLNRMIYHFRAPKRGELVVLHDPGHTDFAVKRIVGLPLENLTFKDGRIQLDGRPLEEPYLTHQTVTALPDVEKKAVQLGQDYYFVLGDNRGNSEDSRIYGQVHRRQIVGMLMK